MHTLPINLPLTVVIDDHGSCPLGIGGPNLQVTGAQGHQSLTGVVPRVETQMIFFRSNL